jgi:hypothetical protein
MPLAKMPLAQSTIKRYESVMKVLKEKFPNGEIESDPKAILAFLETKYPNPNSRRTSLSALYNSYNKPEYMKACADVRVIADEHQKSQHMSQEKQENYMEWLEVMKTLEKIRDAYYDGNESLENLLIVSLYTLQPPVRLDYAGMSFTAKDSKSDVGNYAILNGKQPIFVYNDYKTKNVYGKAEIAINKKLLILLQLYASKNESLAMSRDNLSKRVISLFKKYAGKEMSVIMLRRSFITDFLSNNVSENDKERMAKMMLHSKNIQAFYNVPAGSYGFMDD